MGKFLLLSAAEQVAAYLRNELASGTWREEIPGATALAAELGVNHKTVEAALNLLVREGLLTNQGSRKPRRIEAQAPKSPALPSLRIALLLHDTADRYDGYIVEIRHRLLENGHAPFFAKRSLTDLGMNTEKVAAFVKCTSADAWLVQAASRGVLEWFAAETKPVFALFGFIRRVTIASSGPDKSAAYAEVARSFASHGHQKIVLLARPQRRVPMPGHSERIFLRTLGEAGIQVSDYHFPIWEDSREGFRRCLESLFQVTPPTALIVQEAVLFGAVQQFLAERGIRVPHDVSLVCDDPDPTFAWRIPSVAHIRWDDEACVRRVVLWANNIASGKNDRRRVMTRSEFVPGDTIGPVNPTK